MLVARDAQDVGAAIRAARRAAGITQAELASRAGVGRQWLVRLERGHPGAELERTLVVLGRLGHEVSIAAHRDAASLDHRLLTVPKLAEALRAEVAAGDTSFALRLIGRSLHELRQLGTDGERATFLAAPASTGDRRWDQLVAVAFARQCRLLGLKAPCWTETEPLRPWWFPIPDRRLVARTMQRTPIEWSVKGLWLDPKALEVV